MTDEEPRKRRGIAAAVHRENAEDIVAELDALYEDGILDIDQKMELAKLHTMLAQVIAWNRLNETIVTATGARRGGPR